LPNGLTETTLDVSVRDYQSLGVIAEGLDPAEVKALIWSPLEIESV
jgi:hypothetical protein